MSPNNLPSILIFK